MKEMKRTSYISAYPLKALEQAQAAAASDPSARNENSAYLKGLLAERVKSVSRIRISPMSNPYKAPLGQQISRTTIPSEDLNPG